MASNLALKCNYPCPFRGGYAPSKHVAPPYDKSLIPPEPACMGRNKSAGSGGQKEYQMTFEDKCCPNCICCPNGPPVSHCPSVNSDCPHHKSAKAVILKPAAEQATHELGDPGPYRPGQIADNPAGNSAKSPSVPYPAGHHCPCPPDNGPLEEKEPFKSSTVAGCCKHEAPNLKPQPPNNENAMLWPEKKPKCPMSDVAQCCKHHEGGVGGHEGSENHGPADYEQPGLAQLRPAQPAIPPCYLPQPGDDISSAGKDEKMGPIGPWATGRVDWGPLAGLTGTRPVVDKYSITRYSEAEWRQANANMLGATEMEQRRANMVEFNGRRCIDQSRYDADKNQADNTNRLEQRCNEIHRWKCELERAIAAAADEIEVLEAQRNRLKQAASVLALPESIAGECLERRTSRLDPELTRDEVEEELINEVSLISEIRILFAQTLSDIELQMIENKTAKQRLEVDWSDKKISFEVDSLGVALNNRSNVILFKPGATRFQDNQSSAEHWEHFTRETLREGEATRQKSVAFRSTLNAILLNTARDMRTQADKVDAALTRRIACTDQLRELLENKLKDVLQKLADIETLIEDLENLIRRMDCPMKVAQMRLDNRMLRQRVESCRDVAQFTLVDEVKSLGEQISAISAQLRQAQDTQAGLVKARCTLEKDIMNKRKTLEIDRTRCQLIRSYFPSAAALSGNA